MMAAPFRPLNSAQDAGACPAQQGFSLVELMIVVSIIGVLAALAVPNFQRFQAKAKQAEAKTNLSHIFTLQMSYHGDNDTYWDGFGIWGNHLPPIGFKTEGRARYVYSTASSGPNFLAGAVAWPPSALHSTCTSDIWWINDTKALYAGVDCSSN